MQNWIFVVAKAEPSVGAVVLTGITIVFFVLVLIMGLIKLQGAFFQWLEQKRTPPANKQTNPTVIQPPIPEIEQGIPPETVAAIVAAIAAAEPNARICSVKQVKTQVRQNGLNEWARQAAVEATTPFETA